MSVQTAAAMAEGALRVGAANIGVAITGIAGPGGGSAEKPVGTVCFGIAGEGLKAPHTQRHLLPGDRRAVRIRAAHIALELARRLAKGLNLLEISPRTLV